VRPYISRVVSLPFDLRFIPCLACGGTIEELLVRLGSLRCCVCRLQQAPLDPALVESCRHLIDANAGS
jgi:hypothetical protein